MIEPLFSLSVHIRTPTINSALYITVEDIRLTSKTSKMEPHNDFTHYMVYKKYHRSLILSAGMSQTGAAALTVFH